MAVVGKTIKKMEELTPGAQVGTMGKTISKLTPSVTTGQTGLTGGKILGKAPVTTGQTGLTGTSVTVSPQYVDQAKDMQFLVSPNSGFQQGTYLKGGMHLTDPALNQVGSYLQKNADVKAQISQMIDAEIAKGRGITDEFAKTNLAPLYQQIYNNEDFLKNNFGLGQSTDYGLFSGISNRGAFAPQATTAGDGALRTFNKAPSIGGTETQEMTVNMPTYLSGNPAQSGSFQGGQSATQSGIKYGANVANFEDDPTNPLYIALADAGKAWWAAKDAGDTAGMQAAEAEGARIRAGLPGSTYDSRTGISTLGSAKTGGTGVDGGYGAQDVQNEIQAQLNALNSQLASQKSASDYQVGVNNQYLQDQLNALASGEAVALDQAQQIQNRFGGLYSGGLPYQSAEINRTYAGQRGGLARDIAGRNQQILDQYGTQANEIAANIARLQSTAPQVIRDRILEYQLQTAPITGTFQGAPTFEAKQFEYAKGRDKVADSQWKMEFDEDNQRYGEEFAYQQARDKIKDAEERRQFDIQVQQNGLDRAVQWYNAQTNRMGENRLASGGGSGGSSGGTIVDINLPTTAATMRNYIIKNLPGGKYIAGPPDPNQIEDIENMILSNPNLSEDEIVKLYGEFGIHLPQ